MNTNHTRMIIGKCLLIAGALLLNTMVSFSQRQITLKEALNIAFENSPEIRKTRLEMEQRRELLNANLAALKSRFTLDVSPIQYQKRQTYDEFTSQWYTSENKGANGSFSVTQPIQLTDGTLILKNDFAYQDNYSEAGNTTNKGYNNSLYLRYDQPLFKYNKTKMGLKRNELSLENATLTHSIQMLSMESQVSRAFYNIYQKQMGLKVAKEDFENQKISKKIIESKVEGGLMAKEELYQAELNYATSESAVKDRVVDLENAMDEFKQLLGLSLFEKIDVKTDIEYVPVVVDLEKAIQNGLAQRLELSQRKIDLNNAEFDLIETAARNKFSGNVGLSFGYMGNDSKFQDIYNRPTKSPEVGITFSIPVFDWGERKARIRAAELEIESRQIDMKQLEDDIVIKIRRTYRDLNNYTRKISIENQNVKNAQLTYDINLERYRNGDLTSMDLERFQSQLSEKKMSLVNAKISYKLELLNMKIQSLWDFENNRSFVPQELQRNMKSE
ncbi:MAG: TolC family protein [Marinifilaceae bacterium]